MSVCTDCNRQIRVKERVIDHGVDSFFLEFPVLVGCPQVVVAMLSLLNTPTLQLPNGK